LSQFDGSTVVVIGGASGIGAACVRAFHDEGATVYIADLDRAPASLLVTTLGSSQRLSAMQIDVAEADQVEARLSEAAGTNGRVDVLVNCAGVLETSPIADVEPDRWRWVHAVNLDGMFFACRAFARLAARANHGGAIVNIASIAGLIALPNRAAYVSSKHAAVGLTKELAMELGPAGIRVNAVAPGIVRTQ
jgi:meso-butanediol dehydrogenase/(S,S)-butanediol dehydrogenase/diacetyl reductase